MFEKIGLMSLAVDKARHAAARQNMAARNIANADTPGYKAKDVSAFQAQVDTGFTARTTRAQHINFSSPPAKWREISVPGPSGLDGNNVSLDTEVLRSVEAERDHSRAIRVYQASLDLLRAGLGKR